MGVEQGIQIPAKHGEVPLQGLDGDISRWFITYRVHAGGLHYV